LIEKLSGTKDGRENSFGSILTMLAFINFSNKRVFGIFELAPEIFFEKSRKKMRILESKF
jgi:hypothetical protein